MKSALVRPWTPLILFIQKFDTISIKISYLEWDPHRFWLGTSYGKVGVGGYPTHTDFCSHRIVSVKLGFFKKSEISTTSPWGQKSAWVATRPTPIFWYEVPDQNRRGSHQNTRSLIKIGVGPIKIFLIKIGVGSLEYSRGPWAKVLYWNLKHRNLMWVPQKNQKNN